MRTIKVTDPDQALGGARVRPRTPHSPQMRRARQSLLYPRDGCHAPRFLGGVVAIRSAVVKNPCQVPAVVGGVVSIRSKDIGEFHRAAFRVQYDDSSGNRLIDGAKPISTAMRNDHSAPCRATSL